MSDESNHGRPRPSGHQGFADLSAAWDEVEAAPADPDERAAWLAVVQRAALTRWPLARHAAVEAIRDHDVRELTSIVFDGLWDSYWLVRCEAVETAGEFGLLDAVPRIRELLSSDRDKTVRGYAAEVLGDLCGEQAAPWLAEALAVENSPWARARLHLTLHRWRPEAHLEGILRAFRSRSYVVREVSAKTMPEPDSPAHAAVLVAALADALLLETAPGPGESQIDALLFIGGPDAIAAVERQVWRGDLLSLRLTAVKRLVGVIEARRLRALVRPLGRHGDNARVRRAVRLALAEACVAGSGAGSA